MPLSTGGGYENYFKKWIFSDKDGKQFIDNSYISVKPFNEGVAAALKRKYLSTQQEKWGFIDKSGNFIIEPKFFIADSFNEGLAAVCEITNFTYKTTCGYIDKTGNYAIKLKPASVYGPLGGKFSEGLAPVAVEVE